MSCLAQKVTPSAELISSRRFGGWPVSLPTSSGTIAIDGEDVSKQDAALLRRKIGYVIQHAGLFPHRTVLDNVGTVPELLGWDKKKTRERSMELLERVGLDIARRHVG